MFSNRAGRRIWKVFAAGKIIHFSIIHYPFAHCSNKKPSFLNDGFLNMIRF